MYSLRNKTKKDYMTEQDTRHADEPSDKGRLSYDDALMVAHDPTVKENIDKAAAYRRVAKRISDGVEQGESALPGIQSRAELAHLALGNDRFGKSSDSLITMLWNMQKGKRRLKGQNLKMLVEDDMAASTAYVLNDPYYARHREKMTPGEITNAEIGKAAVALDKAFEAETKIAKRTGEILDAKEPSTEVLAQLANVKGRLGGQRELTTGTLWERYDPEATTPADLADTIVETLESDPGLRALVEQALRNQDR